MICISIRGISAFNVAHVEFSFLMWQANKKEHKASASWGTSNHLLWAVICTKEFYFVSSEFDYIRFIYLPRFIIYFFCALCRQPNVRMTNVQTMEVGACDLIHIYACITHEKTRLYWNAWSTTSEVWQIPSSWFVLSGCFRVGIKGILWYQRFS